MAGAGAARMFASWPGFSLVAPPARRGSMERGAETTCQLRLAGSVSRSSVPPLPIDTRANGNTRFDGVAVSAIAAGQGSRKLV